MEGRATRNLTIVCVYPATLFVLGTRVRIVGVGPLYSLRTGLPVMDTNDADGVTV